MTSFIFVRHGKSQDNQDDVVSTPQTLLTKEGEAQARKTGRDLRNQGITTILTSPFPRAWRTAEIIAKQLKLAPETITVVDDLRERGLGQLEGRKHDHKHTWYFTVEGESDVEPRGVLIARCESALNTIKKAAVDDKVLVVGHTICGYYLREVAAGKRLVEQFNEPRETPNAGFQTVTITETPMATGSKTAGWSFAALLLGAVLLAWGLYLKMQQSPAPAIKEQTIPLSPEDYNGDPQLQGAVQKLLQDQDKSEQSGSDASGQLQPAANDIPKEW
ncbi:MAG TPA: histidine phosphatase family protein [Magnetospirillaceae bacterium]|nr:histidine phosphatase family protein [Magnetospirillaceae bacterium]